MAVYPRKQTVVILVVCILAVGGVAFYVRGDPSGIKSPTSNELVGVSATAQEALPENADWRQQFIDKSSTSTTFRSTAKAASSEPEKLTATDLLGRSFLTKYGELQQSGLITDNDTVTSVMSQVTSEALENLPSPKTFSITELAYAASTSEALSAYIKTVTKAFAVHTPKQNEAQIATQALNSNDMSLLKNIDPIVKSYSDLLGILKATPVPAPLAQQHIYLLNNVSLAVYTAEAMRHMDTDPVRGLTGASLGLAAMQNIANALYSINDYLVASGVQPKTWQ